MWVGYDNGIWDKGGVDIAEMAVQCSRKSAKKSAINKLTNLKLCSIL